MTMTGLVRPGSSASPRQVATLALPIAAAIGLAAVGAFGSYVAMPFPLRLVHFLCTALCIGTAAALITAALRRYVFAGGLPLWASLGVAVVTAPLGAAVVLQSLHILSPLALRYVSFGELTGQVLLVNLLVGGVRLLLAKRGAAVTEADRAASPPRVDAPSELREKLPFALRQAAIVALSAEDHYVRVHTDRGQALILMDLTGAIAALGPQAGVRIHRSHWAARSQLTNLNREGVRIDAETVLPVSRAGRKLLKELCGGAGAQRVGTGLSPR